MWQGLYSRCSSGLNASWKESLTQTVEPSLTQHPQIINQAFTSSLFGRACVQHAVMLIAYIYPPAEEPV